MASKLDELMALVQKYVTAQIEWSICESLDTKQAVDRAYAAEAALQSALKAVVEDAKRYRWLREHNGLFCNYKNGAEALRVSLTHFDGTTNLWVHCNEGLDAAIDAARKH